MGWWTVAIMSASGGLAFLEDGLGLGRAHLVVQVFIDEHPCFMMIV